MADNISLTCWSTPDRLGIGLQIRNLAGQNHHQNEELVQLDTGYSEELLVPQVLFESLELARWQLPDSVAAQGTTVTGQIIKFNEAPVDIIIPRLGEQHRVIAQTFAQNTRLLLGRGFLRRFKVLLDGPSSQTCLLTSNLS
jgi:hypothetical protein